MQNSLVYFPFRLVLHSDLQQLLIKVFVYFSFWNSSIVSSLLIGLMTYPCNELLL